MSKQFWNCVELPMCRLRLPALGRPWRPVQSTACEALLTAHRAIAGFSMLCVELRMPKHSSGGRGTLRGADRWRCAMWWCLAPQSDCSRFWQLQACCSESAFEFQMRLCVMFADMTGLDGVPWVSIWNMGSLLIDSVNKQPYSKSDSEGKLMFSSECAGMRSEVDHKLDLELKLKSQREARLNSKLNSQHNLQQWAPCPCIIWLPCERQFRVTQS